MKGDGSMLEKVQNRSVINYFQVEFLSVPENVGLQGWPCFLSAQLDLTLNDLEEIKILFLSRIECHHTWL